MKKLACGLGDPSDGLHDLRLNKLTGTLHIDCSSHAIISAEIYTKLMIWWGHCSDQFLIKHRLATPCWVWQTWCWSKMLGHLAKVSYILSLVIILLWLHLHDLSFDCPENDGLINASLKNQTTLINHRKGSKANPPRKCVGGTKENTRIAHNK